MGFIALVCALAPAVRAERTVTLAWNPSADSSVMGYRVYTREENSTNLVSSNVLGLTQVTLPGLKEGMRYTFTVTAYNAAGVESVPSNEASFVVPVPLQMLPGTTSAAKRLQFPMAPGHWYEVQASTDLKAWNTVWASSVATTYGWTEYQDTNAGAFSKRFYRLQVH